MLYKDNKLPGVTEDTIYESVKVDSTHVRKNIGLWKGDTDGLKACWVKPSGGKIQCKVLQIVENGVIIDIVPCKHSCCCCCFIHILAMACRWSGADEGVCYLFINQWTRVPPISGKWFNCCDWLSETRICVGICYVQILAAVSQTPEIFPFD